MLWMNMPEKLPDGMELVTPFEPGEIVCAFHDIDGTHSKIREWVREERLYFSEGSNTGISCERCGVMIQTGRYCNRCKSEMSNSFRSAITPASTPAPAQKTNTKVNPKMRFLDSDQ